AGLLREFGSRGLDRLDSFEYLGYRVVKAEGHSHSAPVLRFEAELRAGRPAETVGTYRLEANLAGLQVPIHGCNRENGMSGRTPVGAGERFGIQLKTRGGCGDIVFGIMVFVAELAIEIEISHLIRQVTWVNRGHVAKADDREVLIGKPQEF